MILPGTKAELGELYHLSPYQLGKWMNKVYFDDLEPLGYKKTDSDLKPKIVRKFIELHGEPLKEKDFDPKI